MVGLGLVLMLVGLIALLSALFVSEGSAELLGMELSALTIFAIGLVSGVCLIWGFGILKWGTRRSIADRKERKELRRRGDPPAQDEGDPGPETGDQHR